MSIYDQVRARLESGDTVYVSGDALDDRSALRIASLIRCRCIYRIVEHRYEYSRHAIRASHRMDRVIS